MKVTPTLSNLEEVKDPFYKGHIHGVVLIPADFSHKINRKEQATVSTYSDMSSFLYYRTMALGTNFAILEHGHEIKMERVSDAGIVGQIGRAHV